MVVTPKPISKLSYINNNNLFDLSITGISSQYEHIKHSIHILNSHNDIISKIKFIGMKFIILNLQLIGPCSSIYIIYRIYRFLRYLLSNDFRFNNFIYNVIIKSLKLWSLTEILFYCYYLYRSYRLNRPITGAVASNPIELLNRYLSTVEDIQEGISLVLNESYRKATNDNLLLLQFDCNYSSDIIIDSEQDLETLIRHAIASNDISDISSHLRIIKCKKQLLALKHTEIRSWFFGASIEQIYRDKLNDTQHKEMELLISTVEVWANVSFSDGINRNVKCIRTFLDPVQSMPRPLFIYAVVNLPIAFALSSFLNSLNFRSEKLGYLRYWYRPAVVPNDEPPIVFCHGVGVGNISYKTFISMLTSYPNRSIFLLMIPHISMSLMETFHTDQQSAFVIRQMIELWGYKKAHFVGHSAGTCLLSWLAHCQPDCISQLTFVDPVCFLFSRPDFTYNFMYRNPKDADQNLTNYFISRELGIAYTFTRTVLWHQSALFPDDLKVPTLIALCGNDDIVPAATLQCYFTSIASKRPKNLPIEVLIFDKMVHGESICAIPSATKEIIDYMMKLEKMEL